MTRRLRLTIAAFASAVAISPLLAQSVPAPLGAAVASSERPAEDSARDADRKPAEVMAFAGVRPGMRIVEMIPGGGYYTRLLTLAVGPEGRIYPRSNRFGPAINTWAASHGTVAPGIYNGESKTLAPEPVDLVWTTQNYHDLKNNKVGDGDAAAFANRMAFAALKPGGIYLVNDHDAAPGAGASVTSTLHRIEAATVIQEVEAAGFKLEAQSDVLRHPGDDRTQRVFETGVRGKTDQFVLKFRKPGKAAKPRR